MRLRQLRALHLHPYAYVNCAAIMGAHLNVGLRSSIVMRHLLMAMNCWLGISTDRGMRIDHGPNAASCKLEQKGKDQRPKCSIHESIIRSKNLAMNYPNPRIFLVARYVILCFLIA
jgi:hypothetical protein